MKKAEVFLFGILALTIASKPALANRRSDPAVPLSHCYHWLNESSKKYLSFKYQYAQKNDGAITFYTTPGTSNGSAAGEGFYCGKTPIDSLEYGDRVIRVEFVKDVVVSENNYRKHCGLDGKYFKNQAECDAQAPDVVLYSGGGKGEKAWYVIKNPDAIANWTAASDALVSELNASKADATAGQVKKIDDTIKLIKTEMAQAGGKLFANSVRRIVGLDRVKDSAAPNHIEKLDAEVKAQQGKKPLVTIFGGIGSKHTFLFSGSTEKAIADQCRTFSEHFKADLASGRTTRLRLFMNDSGVVGHDLLLKAPTDFCEPVTKAADAVFGPIRAQAEQLRAQQEAERAIQQALLDARKNFGRPSSQLINVDLDSAVEKINITANNESEFVRNCGFLYERTKLGTAIDVTVNANGRKRPMKNVASNSSQFCARVFDEVAQTQVREGDERYLAFNRPGLPAIMVAASGTPGDKNGCQGILGRLAASEKSGMRAAGFKREIDYGGDDAAFCSDAIEQNAIVRGIGKVDKYFVDAFFNDSIHFTAFVANKWELECQCRKFLRSKYTVGRDLLSPTIKLYRVEVTGKDKTWTSDQSTSQETAFTACSMVRDVTFDRYEFPWEDADGWRICPRE